MIQLHPDALIPAETRSSSTRTGAESESEITFDLAAIQPLKKEKALIGSQRPALTYLQDVRRRFFSNKQAVTALSILIALVFFVGAGPLIWTIPPEEQNLSRASIPPFRKQEAIVVDEAALALAEVPAVEESAATSEEKPAANEVPAESIGATEAVSLMAPASTMGIKISWIPVVGASKYVIYRNEAIPEAGSWGVPIGETTDALQTEYLDSQSLEPIEYHYTVIAKDSTDTEAANGTSLSVSVLPGLSLQEALGLKPEASVGDRIQLPSSPLGTDGLGRDLLSRMMYGGRISLAIGLFSSVLYTLIGVLIGGIAGFVGGRVDSVIMRVTDFVMGLPFLLCMILLKVTMGVGPGESGVTAMIVALVVLSWTGVARLVRGQILQLKGSEFVQAARLMGASNAYLIFKHMIPNLMGLILVSLTFSIPSAIFTEAFLSFIGLGVAAPAASWGSLCTDAVQSLFTRPYEFFMPAVLISFAVLSFNLLGDGLRDALDPKLRSQE